MINSIDDIKIGELYILTPERGKIYYHHVSLFYVKNEFELDEFVKKEDNDFIPNNNDVFIILDKIKYDPIHKPKYHTLHEYWIKIFSLTYNSVYTIHGTYDDRQEIRFEKL